MEAHLGVLLEPMLILLVGVEVIDDDVKLAIRKGGNDAVHEAEKLHATAPFRMSGDNLAGGDLERCKHASRSRRFSSVLYRRTACAQSGEITKQPKLWLRTMRFRA
jgi:hypothetical protein